MADADSNPPNANGSLNVSTRLVHTGRGQEDHFGFVNVPPYRGSTVLFEDCTALRSGNARFKYGRRGNPSSEALEGAITELERGADTVLAPSGLAAVAATLIAFTRAGDHMLVADTVYGPTRDVVSRHLARMGVTATFYDPCATPADVLAQATPATRILYCESPGSQSFEVQDLPALAQAAHARGLMVIADNTWASPLYCQPLALGADVSIQAGTKYIVGHADAMLGSVTANAEHARTLRDHVQSLGICAGSEEVYLGLRGLRTLDVRLERHHRNSLAVAQWLATQPGVARVLHPALETHPTHALWLRDFSGASGLFGVILNTSDEEAVTRFCDALHLFGMGYSWGGYESLVVPFDLARLRSATPWPRDGMPDGACLRFHIGLEDPGDLVADLASGFHAAGLD